MTKTVLPKHTKPLASDFALRREQLIAQLGEESIAILPTAIEATRNNDVTFPFRPESNFLYLTGFWEPEAVLVLMPGRKHGPYILFCRDKDKQMEIWHGFRHGQAGARDYFAADDAYSYADMDEIMPLLMENKKRIYYSFGQNQDFDERVIAWNKQVKAKVRQGISAAQEIFALDKLIHEMRLRKSPQEIKWMKKAAKISAKAHKKAMKVCKPGLFEYHLEGAIVAEYYRHGCPHAAYPSIVGSGANACVLHYTENNSKLKKGDLVLIDAGVEYQGYAADITRTFPVSGKFSKAQSLVYQLVLDAQAAAIAEVKPGNHWNQPHEAVLNVLTKGLVKLGLLTGDVNQLIKDAAYMKYFMHKTGHWLGIDVHDVGDYKLDGKWRVFEPGMTLTIEPGLYIARDSSVDKKWWNIGIRIEDDVLVTEEGCEVLTKQVPKSIKAIEKLMASKS